MANENNSLYTKIGLTVVLGIVAILATLIYLGGIGNSRDEFLVETVYDSPISGLSIGSAVNFRGVRVGEVRKISFLGAEFDDVSDEDMQRIYILIALNRHLMQLDEEESAMDILRFHLERGLRATVTANGITGLARIELNYPKVALSPAEQPTWSSPYPFIPSLPSMLESFSTSAQKFISQLNQVDFNMVMSNVTATTDSIRHLSGNVDYLIDAERARITAIIDNLEDTTDSLRDLSRTLKNNPSLLLRSNDPEHLEETR